MTKELTEQWRNGTLEEGYYYVHHRYPHSKNEWVEVCEYRDGYLGYYKAELIVEVLAPVPTYEEWEELQEANDGLSKQMFKSLMNRFVKADEEREKLEQQLKEANKVIKKYADGTFEMETPNFVGTGVSFDPVFGRQIEDIYDGTINVDVPYSNDETPAKEYLEKWGVK